MSRTSLTGPVFLKQLYDSFPALMKHLPGPHNGIFSSSSSLQAFIWREIQRHKSDLDPSNPRDYIDAFLIEEGVRGEKSRAQYSNRKDSNQVVFVSLRTETTSWDLRRRTWFCVVWICSWLAAKPPPRPCSGGSSTSSGTPTSRVGAQTCTIHRSKIKFIGK